MKKLSLILALLMVATCCMLASCGGDDETSSTAASSAATSSAATSSAAASSEEESSAAVSSEEASSEEASSEEASSEEPGFVKNPDAISTEGENVAAGKTYVVSEQYRQNSEWKYDETCEIVYPDDGVELTDGLVPDASEGYTAAGWAGFNINTPAQTERGYAYINVDLAEIYAFTTVDVTLYAQSDVGIGYPSTVTIAVSEDGENFVDVAVANVSVEGDGVAVVTVECDATGRYVQVKLAGGTWNFIGEIEVK